MSTDGVKLYHFLYGLHSHIPLCCIRAYINDKAYKYTGWGYLPCQKCLENNKRVELHICKGLCIRIQRMMSRFVFGYARDLFDYQTYE